MLVKTLYFRKFYETVEITTLEKSYNFVTKVFRHFYRQLFPFCDVNKITDFTYTNNNTTCYTTWNICAYNTSYTTCPLQYVNKAFTQRYTTLLLKVLLLVLGCMPTPFGTMFGSWQRKPPNKTYTKLSRVLLHVLRPPGVVYVQTSVCAFGVVSCKNHTSHYVRVTQARKSTRIRSLNDVLSLLSFTSPLDPLRSRVAPFTFFNRYTFVTHTRYTSYLHHVLSLVLTLLCHHVNSYIFSYLRIWTPTTTP